MNDRDDGTPPGRVGIYDRPYSAGLRRRAVPIAIAIAVIIVVVLLIIWAA